MSDQGKPIQLSKFPGDFTMRSIRIIPLIMLFAIMSAQAKVVPLDSTPEQKISISGRTTTEVQVRAAILGAAAARGWEVVGDEPGKLTLRYAPRDFSVTIAASYKADRFKISYVSSQNLDYVEKKGLPYIHSSYSRWVANLTRDIQLSPIFLVDIPSVSK